MAAPALPLVQTGVASVFTRLRVALGEAAQGRVSLLDSAARLLDGVEEHLRQVQDKLTREEQENARLVEMRVQRIRSARARAQDGEVLVSAHIWEHHRHRAQVAEAALRDLKRLLVEPPPLLRIIALAEQKMEQVT